MLFCSIIDCSPHLSCCTLISKLLSVSVSVVQTKVLQMKQRSDFSHSGQWDVETENKDGKKEKHIFDAVMICIGHHCHPNMPLQDFPGTNNKV